jgi:hypothetical protein
MHKSIISKDGYKDKNPDGAVCIGAFLCLGKKDSLLELHECWPLKALGSALLAQHRKQNLIWNAIL